MGVAPCAQVITTRGLIAPVPLSGVVRGATRPKPDGPERLSAGLRPSQAEHERLDVVGFAVDQTQAGFSRLIRW
jgi:hypothetical protein